MQEVGHGLTKSSLSSSKRQIVELMQRLNFGRVEGLAVRDGEPVFNSPPRVVREVKFCAENSPRPEAGKDDFALKAQVRELFDHMEAMGDGIIGRIEVKHGLPFRMILEESIARERGTAPHQ